jgi:hypothetical protein
VYTLSPSMRERVRSGERNKVFQAYCVKLSYSLVLRCYLAARTRAESFDEIGSICEGGWMGAGRMHAAHTHALLRLSCSGQQLLRYLAFAAILRNEDFTTQ